MAPLHPRRTRRVVEVVHQQVGDQEPGNATDEDAARRQVRQLCEPGTGTDPEGEDDGDQDEPIQPWKRSQQGIPPFKDRSAARDARWRTSMVSLPAGKSRGN